MGALPKQKGNNPKLAALMECIIDGKSNWEILMENNDYIMNIHQLDKIRTTMITEKYRSTRRYNLEVCYISGTTGSGKTRYVLDTYGDADVYRISDYTHPFDGYQTQKCICFDEFRSNLRIGDMLQYLDIYPVELPARYSNRFSCYEHCFLISNWRLEEQYRDVQRSDPETWQAFLRRIGKVMIFHGDGTREVYSSVKEYFDQMWHQEAARRNPFEQD